MSSPAGASAVAGAADELRRSLSAPPPSAASPSPSNPQQHAHSVLQSIRDSSDPNYLFLRTAIELVQARSPHHPSSNVVVRPEDEELLFHCVTGYRHVYLRTWRDRSKQFLEAVRDWTLHVGLVAPNVPNVVRSACLGAAACFWKRCWPVVDGGDNGDGGNGGGGGATAAGDGSEGGATVAGGVSEAEGAILAALSTTTTTFQRLDDRTVLYQYVESLLNAPFGHPGGPADDAAATVAAASVATRAASFLSSLLAEMGGTSNASVDYNLSLERHRSIPAAFESDRSIDETLRIGMAALGNVAGWLCAAGGAAAAGAETATTTEPSCAIVTLATEAMGWEPCGVDGSSPSSSKWETWSSSSPASTWKASSTLLRPPEHWRDALIRPDLLGAIFHSQDAVRKGSGRSACAERLGRLLRQMLLHLSSIHGPVFDGGAAATDQRAAYCDFLVDGTVAALAALVGNEAGASASFAKEADDRIQSETLDWLSLILRLVENFKLETLVRSSKFPDLLRSAAQVGNALLESSLHDVVAARGDVDAVSHDAEWRDEALGLVLETAALLGGDPWLLGSAGSPEQEERRRQASTVLCANLAPLYGPCVKCRVRIASLEEHFLASTEADVDEMRENIEESTLEEELESAAALGRLDLASSLNVLGAAWGECLPRLRGLLERGDGVGGGATTTGATMSPEGAATLEEARLLISCLTHLVTDENPGEAPAIPDAVLLAGSASTAHGIKELVLSLTSLAEYQARRAAVDPSDPTLSPLLAETLLRFFERWAAAYVLPPPPSSSSSGGVDDGDRDGVRSAWSSEESAGAAIAFCATLCLHHHCHWPQEKRLQRRCSSLLLSLGRRGGRVRSTLASSGPFEALARVHASTAGTPHGAASSVAAAPASDRNGIVSPEMAAGYKRMPYDDRARVLTSLLVGYGDASDEKSRSMMEGCLGAVHAAFSGLVQALGNGQLDPHGVVARETACLCVEMYGGAARSSELPEPDRIARFVTPSLPHLSGLMNYYARDLSVCEGLLRLFRDYAEGFATVLDREQCQALLGASADLLRGYAAHHCESRVVRPSTSAAGTVADLEEEQNYGDVLCAIQLLIHLGARDFVDFCGPPEGSTATSRPPSDDGGIDSGQITDVVFFGLQQILPLMTSGLLQYPTLCSQYFSLAGFMVETYPEKVCVLPFDLFHGLLQSLLFGMSHSDPDVSKSSLRGIAGLAREHLKRRSLDVHLAVRDDVLDECVRRLLEEVIFRSIVWDRLEPAGAALLPLAAADVNRFAATANGLAERLDSRSTSSSGGRGDEGRRLRVAFERLMKPETLSKVSAGGYEGRMNRLRFKKDFEAFVRDVHSFLVVK